jgi:flagellar biosynthesis regulator FlbT
MGGEYYKALMRCRKLIVYEDPTGAEETYTEEEIRDEETALVIAATGLKFKREKTVKRRKVHKWILSGGGVLEDSGYIAGSNIPIVPVYGKRWFVDNKERFMGAVRLAKDSQRLKNMQLSKLAEISAYSAARKPIMTPEQIAGHENVWGQDNVENYRYLLLNPVTDGQGNEQPMGPSGYSEPPDIPQPLAALLQITEQDVADLMGMQDAAEQMTPNISGVAIELIQTRVDQNNFIYMSNMAKAVKRCGEIWLSMARDVYVERGRKMKTVAENNDIAGITLNTPTIDPETSATVYANDLEKAKFDVAVTVGPSSESKRAGTVRSLVGMLQFAQNDPEMATVLTSMAMMNMEGEGLKDVRNFFRKRLVKMGAVEPNEEEMQAMEAELQAQEPDANAALLLAEAEKSKTQAAVNAAKVANTEADTQLKQAQAGKVLADIDSLGKSDALKVLKELREPAPG